MSGGEVSNKERYRVVVIGGGIIGCGILYHLAELGWTDCAVVERIELTAGSTWHAAGQAPTTSASINGMRMLKESVDLYLRIEAETGRSAGVHRVGGLSLCDSPARLDEMRLQQGRGRAAGMDYEMVSVAEVADMFPLVNTEGLLGAMYDPLNGYVDPSGATHGLAEAARARGATILRHRPVIGLRTRPDGGWIVETEKGHIEAEHVVNAAGFRAREVSALAGHDLPVVPMLHQYLVTEAIDEVAAVNKTLPVIRDKRGRYYLRREGDGLLLGPYEWDCKAWGVDGIPPGFGQELLDPDLDRIEEFLAVAAHRFPAFESAGIRMVVNGPITYTTDDRPIMGPVAALPGYWIAAGFTHGIAMGGAAAGHMADYMVNGDPSIDPMPWHPDRFGPHLTKSFTVQRVKETYREHHRLGYPGKEFTTGRPARTTPLYERHRAAGAVFGSVHGWERPLWFADEPGVTDAETMRRSNWFEPVVAEMRAVRDSVGLLDLSPFGKHEIRGPGAAALLDRLFTNRLPAAGRAAVTLMCNNSGGITGDFTVCNLGPDHYYVVGSGVGEGIHRGIFDRHAGGDVTITSRTSEIGIMHLAGPNARAVLAGLTEADVCHEALGFLDVARLDLGVCEADVIRVSFTGDLGYEIHVAQPFMGALFDRIVTVGADFDLALVGSRALQGLRLEKGYKVWGSDLTTEVDPYQAGLGHLVKLDKPGGFIGRDAVAARHRRPTGHRYATVAVDTTDCDPGLTEPLLAGDEVVGYTTGGSHSVILGRGIAAAWMRDDHAAVGTQLEIQIMGERHHAEVVADPVFDPHNTRIRS